MQQLPDSYSPFATIDNTDDGFTNVPASGGDAKCPGGVGESGKHTATEVESDCPAKLQTLGKRITTHLTKAAQYGEKADQHRVSAGQLLAEAQKACDAGGFKAFREKFFPHLAKSRVHELLQIATDKKSIDEVKASTRERVAKHRAKKASASVTVTDNLVSPAAPQQALVDAKGVDTSDVVPEEKLKAAEPPLVATPKNQALSDFSGFVMGLIQRISNHPASRFENTAVKPDALANLGKFFTELAELKRSQSTRAAHADGDGNDTVGADKSAEEMKAQHKAAEEMAA